jgi:hypothetical protein
MATKYPFHEPQSKESKLGFNEWDAIQVQDEKVRILCINHFSEREASRQLAAVCNLLVRMLARDFNEPSPKAVKILPLDQTRGVELRIYRRD